MLAEPSGLGSIQVALLTLACVSGCGLLGVLLNPRLPERHRSQDTARTVQLGIGMVITVASLTLSLLTYSVKGNFDATETNVRAYAASLIMLGRSLHAYGPAAGDARELLRHYTEQAIRTTWPEEFGESEPELPVESATLGDMLFSIHDMIRRLEPTDHYHLEVAAECRSDIVDVERRRFTLIEQMRHSIPPLVLWVVIAWLGLIFLSFGLNAPRNPVVMLTLVLSAVAISSSIYLIDEMDTPLEGTIKISSNPMREALAHLQR